MLMRDQLTAAERELWDAVDSGAPADFRSGDVEHDNPATAESWDTSRQVRAQLLIEMLTRTLGPAEARPRSLRLAGARITGTLDLEAATLAYRVLLLGCFFDEPIALAEASARTLLLPGCHVPNLIASQLRTQGNLELNRGFVAKTGAILFGAHIGGQLSLTGATLTNPNGTALDAAALTVDQAMLCHDVHATGEVRLRNAHIGGQLSLTSATLTNPNGTALDADGLTVDQAMLCRDGRAEGEVILRNAHIGGQLSFDDATLTNPNGTALTLQELHAKALLFGVKTAPEGRIDFTHAQVGVFVDDEATWPTTLALRGFAYDSLYERYQISAAARLGWLDRDPKGYAPQPYEQLVAVYRRAGRDDDARKVAIAKQRRRRQTLNRPGKVWNSLLRWTVGYGYRTWQAGLWLLGLLAVGAAIFAWAHPGEMVLAKKQGEPLPAFQPWVYSLDVLLPVVNLHQEEFWIPEGVARWWAWFSILAGWLLTTVVIAALSGLLKKD